VVLAGGVAAYDLIAADDEQLTHAARRYFKSQPIVTASTIMVTGLHLVGGIPRWCDPISLTFAAYRRLLRHVWSRGPAGQLSGGGTQVSGMSAVSFPLPKTAALEA
jgi:hypothetical protein